MVTVHRCVLQLTWFRCLFVWVDLRDQHHHAAGTPVITITLLLVAVERYSGGIFDRDWRSILFQLSLVLPHPAVYIMILPSMGVVSESSASFTQGNWLRVAFASMAIAILALVWAHHMFVPGLSVCGPVFSLLSSWSPCLAASGVQLGDTHKGISYQTRCFMFGFMGLFTIGG